MCDSVNKRIEDLINRSGSPVMVVHNTQENDSDRNAQIKKYIHDIVQRDYNGSIEMYISDLADTIDRLEVALSNVLNERDQLLKDIKFIVNIANGCCWLCKYDDEDGYPEPCRECDDDKDNWTWRGVPDKS